jgi:hypothetical protein
MLHMIRQLVGDDEKWRGILRGIQSTFWHQTVTGKQIEDYISKQSGINLAPLFAQYLTTTKIPVLEYKTADGKFSYHWTNVVPGFAMAVKAVVGDTANSGNFIWLKPTEQWQTLAAPVPAGAEVKVDPDFLVTAKRSDGTN